MALASELSVYKSTYDLTVETFGIVKGFTREYKYSLGETVKQELLRLSLSIYRANASRERRRAILAEAREHAEALRLLFRLAHDLRVVSLRNFVRLSQSLEIISKQLTAWQRSTENTQDAGRNHESYAFHERAVS